MRTTIYNNYFMKACILTCKLEVDCYLRFNVVHTGFKGILKETILVQENVLIRTGENTLIRVFHAL